MTLFDTPIVESSDTMTGPWRRPRQMLGDQSYEGHSSIHDDQTAQTLGFQGGTIEGPTHFSQFAPLCVALWGERWLSEGCLSAHYRAPVFEGEEVRASIGRPAGGGTQASIRMEKRDGTEVLTGTASVGRDNPPSALESRLAGLRAPDDPVILREVSVGMKTGRILVAMGADQHMGELYPFTLAQKLSVITEPSSLYETIVPVEMISVLLNHVAREHGFPTRGPTVGLFADQEISLIDGPLRVGEAYEIEREIVGLSFSRRTESMWVLTRVFRPGGQDVIATMLLNTASLKASYVPYQQEYLELYGKAPDA